MREDMITVYLAMGHQKITCNVPEDSCVSDVIKNTTLYQDYLKQVTVPNIGIFGTPVDLDYCVQNGDRIELYLPLLIDPMEERKRRVKVKRRK